MNKDKISKTDLKIWTDWRFLVVKASATYCDTDFMDEYSPQEARELYGEHDYLEEKNDDEIMELVYKEIEIRDLEIILMEIELLKKDFVLPNELKEIDNIIKSFSWKNGVKEIIETIYMDTSDGIPLIEDFRFTWSIKNDMDNEFVVSGLYDTLNKEFVELRIYYHADKIIEYKKGE